MSESTGFLATPCPACEGSGTLPENHGQGMVEWLGCPDCHATGWWVHEDIPAVSEERSQRAIEALIAIGEFPPLKLESGTLDIVIWRDSRAEAEADMQTIIEGFLKENQ